MRQLPQVSLSPVVSRPGKRLGLVLGRLPRLLAIPVLLLAVAFAGVGLGAQTASQVTRAVDTSQAPCPTTFRSGPNRPTMRGWFRQTRRWIK
jgi:surfactin synthase thioesterase subunit